MQPLAAYVAPPTQRQIPDMDRSNALVEDILCTLNGVEHALSNALTVTQNCMPNETLPLLPPKKKWMMYIFVVGINILI